MTAVKGVRQNLVAVLLVGLTGCSAFSSRAIQQQVRALARSTAERTDPDGEFVERLRRLCTETPTCSLSEAQVRYCVSLRASVTADHEAAVRLLREVDR